jgi:hypothetical protein
MNDSLITLNNAPGDEYLRDIVNITRYKKEDNRIAKMPVKWVMGDSFRDASEILSEDSLPLLPLLYSERTAGRRPS